MKKAFIVCLLFLALPAFGQEKTKAVKSSPNKKNSTACSKDCSKRKMACGLTTPELDARKAGVLASLRKQVLDRKELRQGFSYKFNGTDSVLDELITFIKTERHCCGFFSFGLKVSAEDGYTWLTITGPDGAKEFIKTELEL